MAAAINAKCDGCGGPGPLAIDEAGMTACALCTRYYEGSREGRAEAAEHMLHLAVAGARSLMSDDEVRRVVERLIAGGETIFRVDGVGS